MTLRDFIETYEGFNWENGEIVIVNQRTAKSYIVKMENGVLHHPYHDMSKELEMKVYNWTHTSKTMLITL